jgi:hypothetical protein
VPSVPLQVLPHVVPAPVHATRGVALLLLGWTAPATLTHVPSEPMTSHA